MKRATLVHELSHRMNSQLHRQVVVESGRKGLYDYDTAWKWSRALAAEQRAARFAAIVKENRR